MIANDQAIPMPDTWNGIISEETFHQFIADLGQYAQTVSVREKCHPTKLTRDGTSDLVTAQKHLLDGSAYSIQVRYIFDGQAWCDTLFRTDAGIRLVRMRDQYARPTHIGA